MSSFPRLVRLAAMSHLAWNDGSTIRSGFLVNPPVDHAGDCSVVARFRQMIFPWNAVRKNECCCRVGIRLLHRPRIVESSVSYESASVERLPWTMFSPVVSHRSPRHSCNLNSLHHRSICSRSRCRPAVTVFAFYDDGDHSKRSADVAFAFAFAVAACDGSGSIERRPPLPGISPFPRAWKPSTATNSDSTTRRKAGSSSSSYF
mmetsp:Transcript_15012/g.34807  ORF Transcript_15012/g.34807 Transcript_15012/m.34807 type:complete len:204 (+) Transcript_15012:2271-2882(+)